jgi:hypothetical protein
MPRGTKKWQFIVIWMAFIAFAVHTIFIKSYYKQQHFIDFKGIAMQYNKTHSTIPDGNILSLVQINSPKYLQFYLDNKSTNFAMDEISDDENLRELQLILDTTKAEYVEYAVLKPQNRIALMMIESRFRSRVYSKKDRWKNGYYLFRKEEKLTTLDSNKFSKELFYKNLDKQDVSEKEYSHSKSFEVSENGNYCLNLRLLYRSDIVFDNVKIVFTKNIKEETTDWFAVPLDYFEHWDDDWSIVDFTLPIEIKKEETLKVYIWNPDKENIEVKGYELGIKQEDEAI